MFKLAPNNPANSALRDAHRHWLMQSYKGQVGNVGVSSCTNETVTGSADLETISINTESQSMGLEIEKVEAPKLTGILNQKWGT